MLAPDVAERDHVAEPRRARGARHPTDVALGGEEVRAGIGQLVTGQRDADELSVHVAARGDALHDLLPEVASLPEADGRVVWRLECQRVAGHVTAVPGHAAFDSHHVERLGARDRYAADR